MPRTAEDIINQAIKENRMSEYLLYFFAILFVIVGLSVLIWAMILRETIIAVTGSISSIFFWPAMSSARRTRKENIAIRLLELPLSKASTSQEASQLLVRLLDDIFSDKSKDG